MKLQVLALMILGCALYSVARSLNDENPCPKGQFLGETGECQDAGRNVIQVPGRCPEDEGVAANKQCLPEWRRPKLPQLPPLPNTTAISVNVTSHAMLEKTFTCTVLQNNWRKNCYMKYTNCIMLLL